MKSLLTLASLLPHTHTHTAVLTEAPSNSVFALGGGGCVNCTLGFRSPRWEVELDGSFTAMSADSEPPDCDCVIRETRLCFQDVTAGIASNYRCQIQRDMSSNLVECDFQVQLASECVGLMVGGVVHTRHPIATVCPHCLIIVTCLC